MRYWIVLLALVLAGCADPKIDSSSEEAMQESVARVRKSLPEDQRAAFDEALTVVGIGGMGLESLQLGPEGILAQARTNLEGKTAQEILSQAAAIRAAREAKEREQALAEISELRAKRDAAAKAAEALKAFRVERSRLYKREQPYGLPEPVIELTVVNGTTKAISRAFFLGTVASPGRAVPWIKDDFNYSIAGGIEPGERASWSLGPNMFSKWGTDVPADAVLTLEVTRLDGADGEPIWDSDGLSEIEVKRLAELEKKFGP